MLRGGAPKAASKTASWRHPAPVPLHQRVADWFVPFARFQSRLLNAADFYTTAVAGLRPQTSVQGAHFADKDVKPRLASCNLPSSTPHFGHSLTRFLRIGAVACFVAHATEIASNLSTKILQVGSERMLTSGARTEERFGGVGESVRSRQLLLFRRGLCCFFAEVVQRTVRDGLRAWAQPH